MRKTHIRMPAYLIIFLAWKQDQGQCIDNDDMISCQCMSDGVKYSIRGLASSHTGSNKRWGKEKCEWHLLLSQRSDGKSTRRVCGCVVPFLNRSTFTQEWWYGSTICFWSSKSSEICSEMSGKSLSRHEDVGSGESQTKCSGSHCFTFPLVPGALGVQASLGNFKPKV